MKGRRQVTDFVFLLRFGRQVHKKNLQIRRQNQLIKLKEPL